MVRRFFRMSVPLVVFAAPHVLGALIDIPPPYHALLVMLGVSTALFIFAVWSIQ